jgi:hypothetical protein
MYDLYLYIKVFYLLHLCLIHLMYTIYNTLFIDKEFERYKFLIYIFTLTIINLIYYFLTLTSLVHVNYHLLNDCNSRFNINDIF